MRLYMTELSVSDWPRCVAWYRDALGLTVEMLDEARKFALLSDAGGRIALKEVQGARCSGTRLSFLTKDLEADRARLIRQGASCGPIVGDSIERFRAFTTVDPEGVPIQVFSWCSGEPGM